MTVLLARAGVRRHSPRVRSLLVTGSLLCLAACGKSSVPRADAPPAADATAPDAALDAPVAACTDQQAATLITTYCTGGFKDGTGSACVTDVGACESKGAYERMTTEQAGCLCYLCQLYAYADDQMVCATSDTAPGYNLQQCLGGTLKCP